MKTARMTNSSETSFGTVDSLSYNDSTSDRSTGSRMSGTTRERSSNHIPLWSSLQVERVNGAQAACFADSSHKLRHVCAFAETGAVQAGIDAYPKEAEYCDPKTGPRGVHQWRTGLTTQGNVVAHTVGSPSQQNLHSVAPSSSDVLFHHSGVPVDNVREDGPPLAWLTGALSPRYHSDSDSLPLKSPRLHHHDDVETYVSPFQPEISGTSSNGKSDGMHLMQPEMESLRLKPASWLGPRGTGLQSLQSPSDHFHCAVSDASIPLSNSSNPPSSNSIVLQPDLHCSQSSHSPTVRQQRKRVVIRSPLSDNMCSPLPGHDNASARTPSPPISPSSLTTGGTPSHSHISPRLMMRQSRQHGNHTGSSCRSGTVAGTHLPTGSPGCQLSCSGTQYDPSPQCSPSLAPLAFPAADYQGSCDPSLASSSLQPIHPLASQAESRSRRSARRRRRQLTKTPSTMTDPDGGSASDTSGTFPVLSSRLGSRQSQWPMPPPARLPEGSPPNRRLLRAAAVANERGSREWRCESSLLMAVSGEVPPARGMVGRGSGAAGSDGCRGLADSSLDLNLGLVDDDSEIGVALGGIEEGGHTPLLLEKVHVALGQPKPVEPRRWQASQPPATSLNASLSRSISLVAATGALPAAVTSTSGEAKERIESKQVDVQSSGLPLLPIGSSREESTAAAAGGVMPPSTLSSRSKLEEALAGHQRMKKGAAVPTPPASLPSIPLLGERGSPFEGERSGSRKERRAMPSYGGEKDIPASLRGMDVNSPEDKILWWLTGDGEWAGDSRQSWREAEHEGPRGQGRSQQTKQRQLHQHRGDQHQEPCQEEAEQQEGLLLELETTQQHTLPVAHGCTVQHEEQEEVRRPSTAQQHRQKQHGKGRPIGELAVEHMQRRDEERLEVSSLQMQQHQMHVQQQKQVQQEEQQNKLLQHQHEMVHQWQQQQPNNPQESFKERPVQAETQHAVLQTMKKDVLHKQSSEKPYFSSLKQAVKGLLVRRSSGSKLSDCVLGMPYDDINCYYRVSKSVLGSGRFGSIHTCLELKSGTTFACKTINKEYIKVREDAEDISREVCILGMLKGQQGIVELHDMFEDDKAVHVVMELCQGGDLFDRLMAKERMEEPTVAAIAKSLAHSLLHCHRLGIMHRDIKPENVLMCSKTDDTLVKLTDFGVSTFFEPGRPCVERAGTPEYMAPEVLQQCYGPEADWWSLGVLLYVLLSGTLPFFDSQKHSLQDRIRTKSPNFRTERWAEISVEAKDFISHLLCKDPSRRMCGEGILGHPWLSL